VGVSQGRESFSSEAHHELLLEKGGGNTAMEEGGFQYAGPLFLLGREEVERDLKERRMTA